MRIEAGKFYLNRQGECVGPMRRNGDEGKFLWEDQHARLYFSDGATGVGAVQRGHDLVKEWINPDEPAQANHATPPPIPPQYRNDDQTYAVLTEVLKDAHRQAAYGKGKDRHANGRPFERQPIMELSRMFGPGFAAGQAAKKAQEATSMINRHHRDAAVAELLGAINYLAACVVLVREPQV